MNKIKYALAIQLSLIVFLVVPFSLYAESKKQYTDEVNLGSTMDQVQIESGELTINGIAISLPGPASNWVSALGLPEKIIERQETVLDEKGNWVMLDGGGAKKKKRTMLLWLSKGIYTECEYAKSLEKLHHCDDFNILLRYEYNPFKVSIYSGRLTLDGVPIKEDTTIFDYRKNRNNKEKYFLYGGNSGPSYLYDVCSPIEKQIGISVRWSNSRGKDPYEYRLTNLYISADDDTFNLRNQCHEQLNSPYRSATEAMASGLFEKSDAFRNEKGECDRECNKKRASFFEKTIEELDGSMGKIKSSEEKLRLQSYINTLKRLMKEDDDASTEQSTVR